MQVSLHFLPSNVHFLSFCFFELRQLDKGLNYFSDSQELRLLRGKLLLKQKCFSDAFDDFHCYSQANPLRSVGFFGMGEAKKGSGDLQEAVRQYTEASLRGDGRKSNVYLKRAMCYLDLKEFGKAIEDLDMILEENKANSEAFYFKGVAFLKQSTTAFFNETHGNGRDRKHKESHHVF